MLSKNPCILLSIVNTKLRDVYSSLDELCEDLDEDKYEIIEILNTIFYEYDSSSNQFILR